MAGQPRPFFGLLAGVAAGVAAAAAMAAFQSLASDLAEEGDAELVTDAPSGTMVHYVTGAVLGGIYGVLTEYRPEASAGFGGAYGVATSALLDEPAAPEIDPAADEVDPFTNAYGVASHLVFGIVLEGVRWLIAGKR